MKPVLPRIVIDTREQLPLSFTGFETVTATLQTGDYSLEHFESQVCIERKSKEDYYQCCGSSRTRWEQCLERLSHLPHALVVIEADLADLATPPAYTRLNAAQAVGSLISWQVQYAPLQWILAGNRRQGERVVIRWLAAFLKHAAGSGGKVIQSTSSGLVTSDPSVAIHSPDSGNS